jgi:hypothetical protein
VRDVVGGVEADEDVVDEHDGGADAEADEGVLAERAHEEEVGGDGQRGQPRHERHAPHLGRPRRGHQQLDAQRAGRPRRHQHHVALPPLRRRAPARGDSDGRGDDEQQQRREPQRVRPARHAPHVVAPDEERRGHHHEDEERADGEQAGEDIEAGEERDAGAADGDERGGVHGGAGPGVHEREHGRDDVAARDVRGVARLPQRAHQQHRGHPLERAQRHHVLRPPHPHAGERHRVGGAAVDGRVRLHHAQHQRHHAVDGRDGGHGTQQAQRDVPRRVPGLLRHGGDVVEPAVGEVHDGGRPEHARHALRHEGSQVGRVGVREPGHDDEGDDEHVHGARHPVDARGALGGEHGQRGGDGDDEHRDGVQLVVPAREPRRVDPQRAGGPVDERRQVRGPGPRHGRRADDALEDEVGGGDEGRGVAELDAQVREGAAGHGDLHGELGVAEDGQHGGEARGDVGEHDGGARVVARLLPRQHEDAGADDGPEAEPGQVPPRQAPPHLVLAAPAQRAQLRGVGGPPREAVAEAGRRLAQRPPVRAPARERRLREEVVPAPPPVAPRRNRRRGLACAILRRRGRVVLRGLHGCSRSGSTHVTRASHSPTSCGGGGVACSWASAVCVGVRVSASVYDCVSLLHVYMGVWRIRRSVRA